MKKMKDLSTVVGQLHKRPKAVDEVVLKGHLDALDPTLFLSAGDAPKRSTYFDLDTAQKPMQAQGASIHLLLDKSVTVHDYRDEKNRRAFRTMITVPPKVRENIREVLGVGATDDFALTTAVIALVDFATQVLKKEGRMVVVRNAKDEQRKSRLRAKRILRKYTQQ